MMQAVIAVVAVVVGLLLGIWIRSSAARSEKASLEKQLAKAQEESAARAGSEQVAVERERAIERMTAERDQARTVLEAAGQFSMGQAARISQLEAELIHERKNLSEKIELLESAKKTLADQFQTLAADILDQKSKKFSEGSQVEIGNLLSPLKTQIEDFRKKVEEAQIDSKTGVATLQALVGNLNTMNQQLSEDARNLTTALRGSAKTQGDWGEFILRDLLDKAGLREGEEYSFQQSFTGMEGENGERSRSVRTDVIVFLPGGRNLVIDSKVSLTAYTEWASAETDEARKSALKQHLGSVRGHISSLAKAGYHRLPEVEAPDFVVMFVPVEPALLMALQSDADLWADAYHQGILLVGPTTLLYVIRIVNVLWQQERQARNVKDVMNRGALLYEKFVGFVTDMEMIGDAIRRADQNYASAWRKLVEGSGNLVGQVQKLKDLGIRTNKSIPKKILDSAAVDQEELALAAEAEESAPESVK